MDVTLTIPWANRIAGATSQTATVAFTTMSQTSSGFTVVFPNNFFVQNALPCGASFPPPPTVTGIPGAAFVFFPAGGPGAGTQLVVSVTTPLPAGSYTAIFSALTFGAQTPGVDNGIQVVTDADDISQPGSPSGPLSGFQVTSLTGPSCQAPMDRSTCQTVTIGFLSTVDLNVGQSLAITTSTFGPTASIFPVSGVPERFTTASGAVVTAARAPPDMLQPQTGLTLSVVSGTWTMSSGPNTISLVGVILNPTGLDGLRCVCLS